MPTLIFHDDRTGREAGQLASRQAGAVALQAVLREQDLRVVAEVEYPASDIRSVAEESAEAADRLLELLPPVLTRREDPGRPAFWECYGEHFRSWCIAPLMANAALARRAAEQCGATEALVLERPAGGWWSFRQQVLEAAVAGLTGSGLNLSFVPGTPLRTARMAGLLFGGPALSAGLRLAGGRRAARVRRWQQSLAAPQAADVLFLAVGGTCVPIVDRLAPALAGSHGLSSAVMMFDPADMGMERGSRCGAPYQHVGSFHAPPACSPGLAAQRQTLSFWRGWLERAGQQAPEAGLDAWWPGIRNRLMVALTRPTDARQTLADMAAAEQILDAYRPAAVVALHLYWHRIAPVVLAAQARGTPVLYLQHGVYLAKDDCIRPLPFDEFMVFGQAPAESVCGRVADGRVTAVGHCLYDGLGETQSREHPARAGGKRLVVVATQPDEGQDPYLSPQWWVRGVALACRDLGVQCVVKLHPRDVATAMYERLAQEMPETVVVMPHGAEPLAGLLGRADALVTRDSTVVIEANLLGTPAITVNLTKQRDRFPFVADGGSKGVYAHEDILPAVRETLAAGRESGAETRAAFLGRHAGPCDGQATGRVAGIIARHTAASRRPG